MKRDGKRRWAFVLVLVMVMGALPAGQGWGKEEELYSLAEGKTASADTQADYGLSNPTTDKDGVTTWDCVWFGNYWQEDTNGNGRVDQTDAKTPVKWRVLSVDGDDAFLVADEILDCQPYNNKLYFNSYARITWETSTMRSWLNGYGTDKNVDGVDYSSDNFLNNAFTSSEQTAILDTTVVNVKNPTYGTGGGGNTTDKVYLLSLAEAMNTAYGFISTGDATRIREAKPTEYAKGKKIYVSDVTGNEGNSHWWLRSPGYVSNSASIVYSDGHVHQTSYNVNNSIVGVRPALHLNLASTSEWSEAGTISLAGNATNPTVSPTVLPTHGLQSPRTEKGVTTWDCVWFGNYWQEDTNGDGTADTNDDKKPIKWRVLSVDGDDAFLLADENLERKPYCYLQNYHGTYFSVTWENCTMRSWLNGYGADKNINGEDYNINNFLNNAFTLSEQAAIQVTNVVNNKNPYSGTPGGNDTTDKVYLLSLTEIMNTAYGFTSTELNTKTREGKNTEYVETRGSTIGSSERSGTWWLRSPNDNHRASFVGDGGGGVTSSSTLNEVTNNAIAVRPTLHLNVASSVWSKAGTVSSTGAEEEIPYPDPTVVPTSTPTVCPTQSPVVSETLPPPTSTPSLLPVSQPPIHKMKVTVKGNGATTVRTNRVYVSTEQMAELTVAEGNQAVFTFIPEEGCSFISVTVDGQKPEAFVGNVYTISYIGQDHDILVEFTEKMPLPTQSPEPTEVPPPQTEKPAPVSTPHPTATPMPVPAKSPVPSKMPPPDNDLSAITDGLGVSEETAIKIQAAARELNVSQDTILVTEQMIQSQKTDEDIKGSYFTHIQARASQITQKNIKLSWNRVKGADGYEIYGNRCNTKKWIYEYKKMKTIENGNKKSFIDRNCKKGTYYKYIVRAYKIIDGKKVTIAASKTIHVTTTGGKNGNAKSVKVNKKKVSLKVGKNGKLKASEIRESKPLRHHREVSYESGDPNMATVSKKGRIKAKKKGKCTIFAYAQSGVFRKIKVTVK